MKTQPYSRQVLDDLEETFEDEGMLPLYQVGWTMSGALARSDPFFEQACRDVLSTFRQRHPELILVLMRWPFARHQAQLAPEGVEIDLDLDPESTGDAPLLVLIDPSDLPT